MKVIDQLIQQPVYIGVNEMGLSYPTGLEQVKNTISKITLIYDIINGVALDVHSKKEVVSEDFRFSKKISNPENFYKFLEETAWKYYNWNHVGIVSRPIELKLDKNSVKVTIDDIQKTTSKKHGNYSIIFFDARFEIDGKAEYGGDTQMDPQKCGKLEEWAKKKLPKTHSIHNRSY